MSEKNHIPKKIHYCWFGKGPKPELANKCIKSWKKYCPDYEIIEWNEKNFDINSNIYVKEAYENKKYAFVTDYVRLYVLNKYGGIYMDTDVEVIKPLDGFLKHRAFSSFENNNYIPTGIMASEKNNKWIKTLLSEYNNLHFINNGKMDLTTNVIRITESTIKNYGLNPISSYQELKNGIVTIYPYDYFCPKDHYTQKINITKNTCTIHHFSGSWLPKSEMKRRKIKTKCIKIFGPFLGVKIGNILYFSIHPHELLKKIKARIKRRKNEN